MHFHLLEKSFLGFHKALPLDTSLGLDKLKITGEWSAGKAGRISVFFVPSCNALEMKK